MAALGCVTLERNFRAPWLSARLCMKSFGTVTKLLVYENFAYLNDEDRDRHGVVEGDPDDQFPFSDPPPGELWRVQGQNGTMLTDDFQSALKAFQMGGNRMAKIEVVNFED